MHKIAFGDRAPPGPTAERAYSALRGVGRFSAGKDRKGGQGWNKMERGDP